MWIQEDCSISPEEYLEEKKADIEECWKTKRDYREAIDFSKIKRKLLPKKNGQPMEYPDLDREMVIQSLTRLSEIPSHNIVEFVKIEIENGKVKSIYE